MEAAAVGSVFFKPFGSDRVWPCRFSPGCAFSPTPIFTFCLCLTLEKREKGDKNKLEKQVTHQCSLNVSETPTRLRFLSSERLLDTRVTAKSRKSSLFLSFEDFFALPLANLSALVRRRLIRMDLRYLQGN